MGKPWSEELPVRIDKFCQGFQIELCLTVAKVVFWSVQETLNQVKSREEIERGAEFLLPFCR